MSVNDGQFGTGFLFEYSAVPTAGEISSLNREVRMNKTWEIRVVVRLELMGRSISHAFQISHFRHHTESLS